jgi:allantoin racemase
MPYRVVVINPNSTQAVTDAISLSVDVHRQGDCQVDCLTLPEGPPGIVTQTHKAAIVAPMQAVIAREQDDADAFVIACYGDPGLQAARESTARPVFGIGEISFYAAMAMGDQFGIISTDARACMRHFRYARELGVAQRMAGDLSIEIPILELEKDHDETLRRSVEIGRQLQARGARSLILGCAGLAPFRMALQEQLGIAIIEPAMVTVGWACAAVRSGLARTPAC